MRGRRAVKTGATTGWLVIVVRSAEWHACGSPAPPLKAQKVEVICSFGPFAVTQDLEWKAVHVGSFRTHIGQNGHFEEYVNCQCNMHVGDDGKACETNIKYTMQDGRVCKFECKAHVGDGKYLSKQQARKNTQKGAHLNGV